MVKKLREYEEYKHLDIGDAEVKPVDPDEYTLEFMDCLRKSAKNFKGIPWEEAKKRLIHNVESNN